MSRLRHPDREPVEAAAEALRNFRAARNGDTVDLFAALLGYRLDLGKQGHLTDGPLRFVALTAEAIISADPRSGEVFGSRPVTELAGYFAATDGKLLVRFDRPRSEFPQVAAFRPLASALCEEQSASAAGYEFLRVAIDVWEARTGERFVNSWSPAPPAG